MTEIIGHMFSKAEAMEDRSVVSMILFRSDYGKKNCIDQIVKWGITYIELPDCKLISIFKTHS